MHAANIFTVKSVALPAQATNKNTAIMPTPKKNEVTLIALFFFPILKGFFKMTSTIINAAAIIIPIETTIPMDI